MRQFLIEAVVICSLGACWGSPAPRWLKGSERIGAAGDDDLYLAAAVAGLRILGVDRCRVRVLSARTAARLQPVEALARE